MESSVVHIITVQHDSAYTAVNNIKQHRSTAIRQAKITLMRQPAKFMLWKNSEVIATQKPEKLHKSQKSNRKQKHYGIVEYYHI